MMKKMMIVLTVLVFACSSLLLVTSCAKKQIKEDQGVPTKPPDKVKIGDTEAYKKAEAERLAKLQALAREQKLRDQMNSFILEKIYFDFDRSELKPEARATLKRKADWLRANPAFFVRIEGHCDERGTNEYNLALGERRAGAAKKFLTALGISDKRLRTISFGEEKPADPGHNESAWSLNRRDEFQLVK